MEEFNPEEHRPEDQSAMGQEHSEYSGIPGDPGDPGIPADPAESAAPPTYVDTPPVSELDYYEQSKWPKVIGIISLIYAILGLTCTGFGAIWYAIMPMLPEMFRGGVETPPIVRFGIMSQSLLGLFLGVLMLLGAIGLLRRRARGVAQLKLWAALRLLLLVIGLGFGVLTMGAQVDMQRGGYEFRNRMVEEQGGDPQPIPSEESLAMRVKLQMGIGTGVFLIYPLFLGLFLSRRKVTDEVAEWQDTYRPV